MPFADIGERIGGILLTLGLGVLFVAWLSYPRKPK